MDLGEVSDGGHPEQPEQQPSEENRATEAGEDDGLVGIPEGIEAHSNHSSEGFRSPLHESSVEPPESTHDEAPWAALPPSSAPNNASRDALPPSSTSSDASRHASTDSPDESDMDIEYEPAPDPPNSPLGSESSGGSYHSLTG